MSWGLAWRGLYWAWLVTELYVAVVTRTRRGGGEVQDRGSMLLLWAVIVGSITAGTWYAEVHGPTMFGGARWVGRVAVGVIAVGLVIRWWSIVSLGRAFSANVAIRSDQGLYRGGLYRLVRHPSYTGLLLILAALGIRTRSWVGLATVFVPSLAVLLYRIHVEEAALVRAFGADYEAYRRESKRLLPGVY